MEDENSLDYSTATAVESGSSGGVFEKLFNAGVSLIGPAAQAYAAFSKKNGNNGDWTPPNSGGVKATPATIQVTGPDNTKKILTYGGLALAGLLVIGLLFKFLKK